MSLVLDGGFNIMMQPNNILDSLLTTLCLFDFDAIIYHGISNSISDGITS